MDDRRVETVAGSRLRGDPEVEYEEAGMHSEVGGGAAPAIPFVSLLHTTSAQQGGGLLDRAVASDLNLDQVGSAIAADREERDLIGSVFFRQLHDVATIRYRQEVFHDLEDSSLFERIIEATEHLRQVRVHLAQLEKMRSQYQRQAWFLDAVAIYCDTVTSLDAALDAAGPDSLGLASFHHFLRN